MDSSYYLIDGEKYHRVTNIIKQTRDGGSEKKLLRWIHKMNSLKQKQKECPPSIKKRMQRGTKLHLEIELYLGREAIPDPMSKDFKLILPHLNWYKPNVAAIEKRVYSKNYLYAGTLDALLMTNKGLAIVDWTTSYNVSRYEWVEHKFLQTAAYATAFEEMSHGKITIEELRVVVISSKVQVFTGNPKEWKLKWLRKVSRFNKIIEKIKRES